MKRKLSVLSMRSNLMEIVENTVNIKPPSISATFYTTRRPEHILYNAFFMVFLTAMMCLPTFGIDMRIVDKRIICLLTILLATVTLKWVSCFKLNLQYC